MIRFYKQGLLTLVFSFLLGIAPAPADVVYDNTSNIQPQRYASAAEFGDQIILAGSNRLLTNFVFEYFGTNFSGDEQARVRFYRNDGPVGSQGAAIPNTVFYDSGFFNIGAAASATLAFGLAVVAPDSFTWTVLFAGLAGTEAAGLTIYSPPTVGNNSKDFWQKTGADWELLTQIDGTPTDFGARFEAASVGFRLGIEFREDRQVPIPGPNKVVLSIETAQGVAFTYTIEVSTDLRNWTTLTTLVASQNTSVTNNAPVGKQFYRARRSP